MKSKILLYLSIACFLSYLGCYTALRFKAKSYIDPIKRAGNAVSIESALEDLTTAIGIIEEKNLVSGSTSVVGQPTLDEDVGAWYYKLKLCAEVLKDASTDDLSEQQKRETLVYVHNALLGFSTYPLGVWVYPRNKLFALWGLLSVVFVIASYYYDHNYSYKPLIYQRGGGFGYRSAVH